MAAAQNSASNFYIPSSLGGGSGSHSGGGATSHGIHHPRGGGGATAPFYAAGQPHVKPVASSQLTFLRVQASTVVGNSSIVVKFICAAIVVGYLISFSPQLILMLTVTPGHLIPPNFWIWTCVTHCFIEVISLRPPTINTSLLDLILLILYTFSTDSDRGHRAITFAFLRTGCEDREYSFAEVFFFFYAEKSLLFGVKIFFPRFVSKNKWDTLAFFF